MSLQLAPPDMLRAEHRCDEFNCGEPILDEWLKRRAMANQLSGATQTFVVADERGRVMGYYALATGAVALEATAAAQGSTRAEPIPVVVLAPLGVDRRARGIKLGGALLRDALGRARAVSEGCGAAALLVHALSDDSWQFYRHFGFQAAPVTPMTLMLRLPP